MTKWGRTYVAGGASKYEASMYKELPKFAWHDLVEEGKACFISDAMRLMTEEIHRLPDIHEASSFQVSKTVIVPAHDDENVLVAVYGTVTFPPRK